MGGPVDPSMGFILHEDHFQKEDTKKIVKNLSLSVSFESMRAIVEEKNIQFRSFIGYAGWGPNQLETEISDGKWLTSPVVPKLIFTSEPDKMWENVLKHMGIDPMTLVPGGSKH